jgi:hypothetical protein
MLGPLPDSFAATRDALHRVAEEIVAPARKPHNEIALRQTPGGFGTPPFEFEGERMQVRVEGAELVLAKGGAETTMRLTTLADAGRFLGADLLPDGAPEDTTPLEVDPVAAGRLGAFYAFADGVLHAFREELPAEADASHVNLWPEHFDIALEAGAEAAGARANYGASPGDDDHPEPYLYVGPWAAQLEGPLWNAKGFSGAELGYAALLDATDPEAAALELLRTRFVHLTGEI